MVYPSQRVVTISSARQINREVANHNPVSDWADFIDFFPSWVPELPAKCTQSLPLVQSQILNNNSGRNF